MVHLIIFTPMRLKILFVLLLLYICLPAFAQPPAAAQKDYDQAMLYQSKKQYSKAIEKMESAVKNYAAYTEAYSLLGEWYFRQKRYAEAATLFAKASTSCKNGTRAFAKPLVKSLLNSYNIAGAQQVLSAVSMPGDKEWMQLQERAAFMQKALKEKWADTPRNAGISINTPQPEMYPCISSDTQTLYFTRRVNGIDEDFYRAKLDSCGGWFYARNLGSPPNTSAQEAAQMISGDGHYLFFMRCDTRSDNGWANGGCDLFMAYTGDSVWSIPQSFGATINTPAYEGTPCLSSDNRELYFTSDREGGYGGLDLWVSRFENGLWQAARNLGPGINTPGNETAPFLHTDNNTLYFASTGHTGMGGTDIYFSRRVNDTTWGGAQNMGYPLNSVDDDNSISISLDGTRAWFASDRDSTSGNFDIYEINLPQQQQPLPVAILKGYSYDSLSKEQLNYTSIYISNAETNEQLYHYTSNRGDGTYMITLPVGKKYAYNADRIGYLEMAGTIDLTSVDHTEKTGFNIPLLPQGYQAPITDSGILIVYFPKNSTQLSETDRTMIYEAMSPWLMEKSIQVMINGYTDNSGTPMLNEELSYLRAGLVAKEINALGIDELNIKSHGWGEADPVAPNDSDDNRNLNRRVEVIIRR
jgi:outer membrane protein OmpA-like peptidoglycan-associated protein